jgi:3-oxoacyl-[acyl-carrier protein] reductase
MTIHLTYPEGCALVAGGAGNVGGGVTRRMAQTGLPVVFTYVGNKARADEQEKRLQAEGLKVWGRQMDMRDAASIDAALAFAEEKGGRVHTVVCTSGAPVPFNNLADFDIAEVEAFFDADGMAYYRLVNRAVHMMRGKGGGSITLSTTLALSRVIPFDGISPFSKGAVDALVRQIAWEEAQHGIRCNAVPISWIVPSNAGEMGDLASLYPGDQGTRVMALIQFIAGLFRMPGPIDPEEAGNLFAFLASDQAKYITGQCISVDAGATL